MFISFEISNMKNNISILSEHTASNSNKKIVDTQVESIPLTYILSKKGNATCEKYNLLQIFNIILNTEISITLH